MTTSITTLDQLSSILQQEKSVVLYFSTLSCNVGEALQPKVEKLIENEFPKLKFYTIDLNFASEVAASLNVFVEPTILVYFDSKETFRKSRNVGIGELLNAIERPYTLFFD
ncbi:thioredoxin family protein [Lutibacter sp.]|uniref:thioredoxin family protein n=1 Tax=Lutibacter sp. TaxID=1925666 RepID=UPI0027330409|nr:thioredoxin family protein [Lutibacter sp.]MDP3313135.1 thioredoxin family protein [Lutibacter sp.]